MSYTNLTDEQDEAGYFKQSTDIIPEDIREEFIRVPADLAYWGERYAEAVKAFLVAEQRRKEEYARIRLEVRYTNSLVGEAPVNSHRKMTEADVDASVEQHPDYQLAKLEEIEAEAAKIAARVRLDAVSAKRDMCMSLGAHIRAEMSPSQLNRKD